MENLSQEAKTQEWGWQDQPAAPGHGSMARSWNMFRYTPYLGLIPIFRHVCLHFKEQKVLSITKLTGNKQWVLQGEKYLLHSQVYQTRPEKPSICHHTPEVSIVAFVHLKQVGHEKPVHRKNVFIPSFSPSKGTPLSKACLSAAFGGSQPPQHCIGLYEPCLPSPEVKIPTPLSMSVFMTLWWGWRDSGDAQDHPPGTLLLVLKPHSANFESLMDFQYLKLKTSLTQFKTLKWD